MSNTWGMQKGDLYLFNFEIAQKKGLYPDQEMVGRYNREPRYYVNCLFCERGTQGNEVLQENMIVVRVGESISFLVTKPRGIKKGTPIPGQNVIESVWDEQKGVVTGYTEVPKLAPQAYHRGLLTYVNEDLIETIKHVYMGSHSLDRMFILHRRTGGG